MNVFEQMIERGHERVAFHHDEETGLRAIIAVHSTTLGNALGGTRRWYYETEGDALYDVLRLAKGMTLKSAVAGLPMGGAKSVILKNAPDQPPTEAEARAMGRFVDTFHGTYIAAEDVGVNTRFCDWMALETKYIMGGETVSRGGDPSPYTAAGIVRGMKAALAHRGKPIEFDTLIVAIQGVGSVGYYVAKILTEHGARIVAADINEANLDRIKTLGPHVEIVDPEAILTTECDILAPCALGAVINGKNIPQLQCDIVCGGANNILEDPDEDAVLLKNAGILYAPDFVVNSGGLIQLAGLYLGMTQDQLDVNHEAIEQTTLHILKESESNSSTYAAAVAVAHQRIAEGRRQAVDSASSTEAQGV
mgnify:CR=1 FL=1